MTCVTISRRARRTTTCLALLFFGVHADRASAQQQTVTGSNERRTIDCRGEDVSVKGSGNDFTLTGDCPIVTILGSTNTIAVDGTERISVTGTNNKITWARALKGNAPRVSRSGLGNVVSRAPAASTDERADPPAAPSARTRSDRDAASAASSSASSARKPDAQASAPAARGALEPLVIETDENTKSYECDGRDVHVNGNENTITLHGTCAIIEVAGNRNTVSVEVVQAIRANGNRNRITWSRAVEGAEPKISNPGSGNVIRRADNR